MKENKNIVYSLPSWGRARVGDVLALLLLMALGSCGDKTFDSKEALMAHVTDPENGYVQQKSINGVNYELTYRPTDMLVQQEMTNDATEKEIDSLRSKYSKYLYFNLSLSKNNRELLSNLAHSRSKFGTMVNQLAFGMGDKVHLVSQKRDTLELLDYVYPREYGMSGATNLMFVYPREEKLMKGELFHFTIEDIGLKTGEVGFKVPVKVIKNEPSINLKV